MKTIQQISTDTGISRVSLYKLIKKPELEAYIKKEGKTTFINEIGEQIIKEYYNRQQSTTLTDILKNTTERSHSSKLNSDVNHINNDGLQDVNHINNDGLQDVSQAYKADLIRILESQLIAKDEQIKEKDNQIQMKDEQIRQKDSQLNALLLMLNNEKNIKLITGDTINNPPDEPPKSFFKRFFKKNK